MNAVIYIHGKGGSAVEAEYYASLFAGYDMLGFDYKAAAPWEAKEEFKEYFRALEGKYDPITLIANSIGAYYSMCAGIDRFIGKAYFISPVVDMEKLICDMISLAGTTEEELKKKGVVETNFGETLSWEYLSYVRDHPLKWNAPTEILYGGKDTLTSFETIDRFAKDHGAGLTVMENGEHWFHTEEQMKFLDDWIKNHE
ncbi:MAG: alpha/beta hydrolase [Clostridia bacterium]|nr:alpha/beta hydrolase [Clostridia bacterium]